MKITLHRALTELKTLDRRIQENIDSTEFVGLKKSSEGIVNDSFTEKEFNENVKSKRRKISDLINRRIKIKTAVVNANAKTTVKIGSENMTIAEAIVEKSFIQSRKRLLEKMEHSLSTKISKMSEINYIVEQNALKIAQTALQKDNVEIGDNDAVNITKPYIDANKVFLVDPIDIKNDIEKLKKYISNFETEVDASLSEINATTFIEV